MSDSSTIALNAAIDTCSTQHIPDPDTPPEMFSTVQTAIKDGYINMTEHLALQRFMDTENEGIYLGKLVRTCGDSGIHQQQITVPDPKGGGTLQIVGFKIDETTRGLYGLPSLLVGKTLVYSYRGYFPHNQSGKMICFYILDEGLKPIGEILEKGEVVTTKNGAYQTVTYLSPPYFAKLFAAGQS